MTANEKDSACSDLKKHEATSSSGQFDNKRQLQSIMILHVRWPGQTSGVPPQAGIGLDFFGTFFIKKKSTVNSMS